MVNEFYRFIYNLLYIRLSDKLASVSWIPIPFWLREIFKKYPMQQRILAYARLLKGQKVFYGVPQEVGCANAVTGILEMVDSSFFGKIDTVDRIDSTITFTKAMVDSDRFIELKYPLDGCIVMSTTGTGNGRLENGHTGIYDKGRIWNNDSITGEWRDSYSLLTWKARYESIGGFKTRYFFPL